MKKSKEATSSKNILLEVELLCCIDIFVAHGLNFWTRKHVSTFLSERKKSNPAGTNELQNFIGEVIEKRLELINGNDYSVIYLTVVKRCATKLQNIKLEN